MAHQVSWTGLAAGGDGTVSHQYGEAFPDRTTNSELRESKRHWRPKDTAPFHVNRNPDAAHQILASRIGAQRLESGIHPEPDHSPRAIGECSLQRSESLVLVAERSGDPTDIEETDPARF